MSNQDLEQERNEWTACLHDALRGATKEHIENLTNRMIDQGVTVTMLSTAARNRHDSLVWKVLEDERLALLAGEALQIVLTIEAKAFEKPSVSEQKMGS